jgi:hypothetical protein
MSEMDKTLVRTLNIKTLTPEEQFFYAYGQEREGLTQVIISRLLFDIQELRK